MLDEDHIRLTHMIDACELTMQFMAGRDKDDLVTDRMLLFAVLRAIEIVGEAAGKVSAGFRAAHPDIPWQAIVAMRNRLIHAYFDIDTHIVWIAATQEIPALLARLRALSDL